MHVGNQNAVPSGTGLVVIDVSFNVVACNADAIQILTFPENPGSISDLGGWLTRKVHTSLVDRRSSAQPTFVDEFRSAKRLHLCRVFPVTPSTNSTVSLPMVVLMLERKSHEQLNIAEIAKRFGLTPREQETARLLGEGLTSKEIAIRMNISPNTVNSFVRLMMVKMGVSSRSAIIGKIVAAKDFV